MFENRQTDPKFCPNEFSLAKIKLKPTQSDYTEMALQHLQQPYWMFFNCGGRKPEGCKVF